MSSEIIICPKCFVEYELNYGDKWAMNDVSVTAQTKCKCKTIQNKQKPLDMAFKRMQDEINLRSSGKISNTNEGSDKG
jgi:hypothetical protein